MPSFNEIAQVRSFKTYKALLKTALAKLKPGVEVKYVALDKYAFDDKERALVLVDFAPDLIKALPKKPTATGKATVNDADKFVFDDSGTPVDKVIKLFADAGIPRAVAHPGDAKGAPSREPEGDKLNMRYGWSEIKKWGSEAQDLIDGYDGLVGVYKGLPEIPKGWAEQAKEFESIKEAMGQLVRTEIANDHDERVRLLGQVQELTQRARKLGKAVREKALQLQQAKSQTASPSKTAPQSQPSAPKDTPTPPQPEAKPEPKPQAQPQPVKTKPELTLQALGQFVIDNRPVAKDTPQKYRGRAERALKETYAAVTTEDLDKLEKLAQNRWFAESEKAPEKPTATKPTATTAVPWQDRVLNLNGTKADLSSFDSTAQGKIEEIVLTGGRGHHGNTALSGSNPSCLHWTVGSAFRLFGNLDGNGNFVLVGSGYHTGKGNSKYKVDLLLGGTCTAQTA